MNSGTDYGERYLTSANLAELYGEFLGLPRVAKWVESGKVRTDEKGRRNEQDVIKTLFGFNQQEIERLRVIKEGNNLKEEIDRARLRKTLLEGDLIEIDVENRRGELVDRREAVAELDDIFAKVRSKLMGLPNRLASELSGLTEPKEIRDRLDEVVREALDELNHSLKSDEPDPSE